MSGNSLQPVGAAAPLARADRPAARRRAEMPVAGLALHTPAAAMINTQPQPRARGTVWAVGALVVTCFTAAWMIPIDKVVTASGKVVSVAPTEVVQPLETAIVRSIDVQEGQVVRKGDLLARLAPTDPPPDLGATTPVQRDEQDAESYKQRLAIASNVAGMRAELQRDAVGSKLNTLQAQDAQVEATRALSASLRSGQQDRAQLQGAIAERDAYEQEWRSKISQDLTEASRKLSESQEQLAKAELRSRLVVLRAGQDGVVQTIAKVSVGSVLASGDQFFTLAPLDAPLEVDANISASESGYVHLGDKVTVKFSTFPFAHYGGAEGTVRIISADAFSSDQQDQRRPASQSQSAASAQSYYRAKVSIDKVTLHNTPAKFHIIPGMPVTADISVGKRTIAGYLLGSMMPVVEEGMREP